MITATERPWVLGISASNHNGAACLLHGDEIVVAIQEERLTRVKRAGLTGAAPSLSLAYCFQHAGIGAGDLSAVVIAAPSHVAVPLHDLGLNPMLRVAHHKTPAYAISHHLAHAVSAYAPSGFDEAAVLVVDGTGSPSEDLAPDERGVVRPRGAAGQETISVYSARGPALVPREKHVRVGEAAHGPGRMFTFGSLGEIFSSVSLLIFKSVHEAGKVMGLAPYGRRAYPTEDFFRVVDGDLVYSNALVGRFLQREPWPAHAELYQDLAASAQAALEDALVYLARRAGALTGSRRLCYAGGVALNSVANERLVRECGFDEVFVFPAAEDSGPAVGAAYHGLWQLAPRNTRRALVHDALGASYGAADVARAIAAAPCVEVVARDATVERAADLLCAGKIVGWFQGRSELGPRALGQRSILCDPRRADGKAVLNARVKHREAFRPFAPAVLREHARAWFDLDAGVDDASPFMLRVAPFRADKRAAVPAVVHVDGTGRLQTLTRAANGRLYDLVAAFHARTGVPLVVNTSFNVMGEPIVETPDDALWCLLYTGVDYVVFDDAVVGKLAGYTSILDLYPRATVARFKSEIAQASGGLSLDLDPDAGPACECRAEVVTRWGPTDHRLTAPLIDLLTQCTGAVTARQLLAPDGSPRADDAATAAELAMTKLLGVARRLGLVAFAAQPSAPASASAPSG